jgi:hypothetical protein
MFPVLTLQALLFRIFDQLRIEVTVFTDEEPVHQFVALALCPSNRYCPTHLCSRLSLAQLNDYIFGRQFAVLYLFHNGSERKTQLRIQIY